MEHKERDIAYKSEIFKTLLMDLIYAYRSTLKKLLSLKTDIRLETIRTTPIPINGQTIVTSKIKNLIGGKIICVLDEKLVNFLKKELAKENYSKPIETFILDFFNNFSSISKNGMINIHDESVEIQSTLRESVVCYIRFDTKIFLTDGKAIQSNFIVALDEITSMYFN